MKGVVIKTTGSQYFIRTEDDNLIEAKLKGKFRIKDLKSTNPIVIGDRVVLSDDSGTWMIDDLLDRKNCIVRRSVNLSKQKHIIASNIDQAILMITLENPVTTTAFIDRFLVSANAYKVEVLLMFNKIDIYNESILKEQKKLAKIYKEIGYNIIGTSVLYDDLSEIKIAMKNKINMISGHSGVGKSTLINRLQPNLNIRTQEVSLAHKQGQHTTTFSQLYELDFGASIIDTPGIKGFGLVDIELKDICNYFPEFLLLKSSCKYYNCIHKNEPDCAIKSAVISGDISKIRYENYIAMLDESDTSFRKNEYL